ncbi:T-cell receptor-associated transmembrane adapter 1 [Physeter macrocephalus]|uniref:T-cell receptor-associated transmembrane adapter 1 n=1 Tax=Physeter macrocephalus TaxID=9755 RepID=UPI000CEACCF0|nr:T-cell receptor-associated transmembrane adapter 1 [Physeter catodon]|eukprot:XP_023976092.1 T-cell receptor-associated transmembrane adapter 1 [Physeter catodon]
MHDVYKKSGLFVAIKVHLFQCHQTLTVEENSECQFYVWAILAFLGLALTISLIFNISHYVEKQRQDKIYTYSDDYFPRENEYDLEDTPIYGNLDNVVPEPVDENYYEQMKAGPERSVNKLQEDAPPSQETEAKIFYASLDHSCEGKRRKPKKQKTYLSDKDEDGQVHAMDINLSKTTLADSFPPESQAIEENVHDDPIRLFGLIRAKKETVN